ncbi:venom acid phosphatase Acph-1-like [Onthophagus taurus]|uniref:venom acid phosphatase Acph-1-like n=1 Tax=Onthophagus taurus TaxID=166361 RepID=UPI0039BEC619
MKRLFISLSVFIWICKGEDIENLVNIRKTLKVLHVVFRHGDRSPDQLYPNDIYTEETFYPMRIGELTNKGKMTEFRIGKSLRRRYKAFLPKTYTPEIISSVSSHMSRNKASLELVLAGLFPPTRDITWNKNLLWEPIPYDSVEKSKNKLFLTAVACPNYPEVERNVSLYYKNPTALKYQPLLPFLQNASGFKENEILTMGWYLYSILKSEEEWGLELPDWTKSVYPDILKELSEQYWVLISKGDLKPLTSGFLVSTILNNTDCTINNLNSSCNNTKIYLYSGHDTNIAGLLAFLDNFVPHNPNYGAHIIIEVHNISGEIYLKFLHENYDHNEPEILEIPNCGKVCKLETFKQNYGKEIDTQYLNKLCG